MKKTLVVSAILGLLFAGSLFAHNLIRTETAPNSFGSAISISDPTVSRVYYSRLDPANPRTWLRFDGRAGDEVYLSVGVPLIERLKDFRPTALLLGPGLPPSDVGFEAPPGVGAMPLPAGATPQVFHEEFTRTDSWIWIEETVRLPVSGTYWFVASPAGGGASDGDKLWMAIGTREAFSLADILGLFSVVRYVREFHEVKKAQPDAGRATRGR